MVHNQNYFDYEICQFFLYLLSPFVNLLCHNIPELKLYTGSKIMNTEDEYFIRKCLNGESEAFEGFIAATVLLPQLPHKLNILIRATR